MAQDPHPAPRAPSSEPGAGLAEGDAPAATDDAAPDLLDDVARYVLIVLPGLSVLLVFVLALLSYLA